MDYSGYGEDVNKHACALIVSAGGRDNHNLDLPIAVDSSSDEEFPIIDRLCSISKGGKMFKALLEELFLLIKLRPLSGFSWCIKIFQGNRRELESQERFERKEKAHRRAEIEGAKGRKHEKLMKPRVENIS